MSKTEFYSSRVFAMKSSYKYINMYIYIYIYLYIYIYTPFLYLLIVSVSSMQYMREAHCLVLFAEEKGPELGQGAELGTTSPHDGETEGIRSSDTKAALFQALYEEGLELSQHSDSSGWFLVGNEVPLYSKEYI